MERLLKKRTGCTKRIRMCVSLLLVVILCSGLLQIPARAASTASEIKAQLDIILNRSPLKDATYTSLDSNGRSGCYAYVYTVSLELFGVGIPTQDPNSNGSKLIANSNWKQVGSTAASTTEMISLLKTSQSGDIIQFYNPEAKKAHTALIYETTSTAITLYDTTKEQGLRIRTYTWNNASPICSFNGVGGGLSLYRCTKDVIVNCSYFAANGQHDYQTYQDDDGRWCGKCASCGSKYYWSEVMTDGEQSTGIFKVLNQYIRTQPYQAAPLANYCAETVKVVGYVTNAFGNKWYVLSDGNFIHSPNVSYVGPITNDKAPDAPTGLTASHSGTSNIQLNWNAVSGATKYEAQYSRSGVSWTDLAASPTTATSLLGKGFSWNYDYVDLRVRAVNAAGASAWTQIRLYKATPNAPSAPTVSVSGSSVTVSWTDVANENGYDVYLIQAPWA